MENWNGVPSGLSPSAFARTRQFPSMHPVLIEYLRPGGGGGTSLAFWYTLLWPTCSQVFPSLPSRSSQTVSV
jgi:hypothetical protein